MQYDFRKCHTVTPHFLPLSSHQIIFHQSRLCFRTVCVTIRMCAALSACQYVCENVWECVFVCCLNESSWCPSGPEGIGAAQGQRECVRQSWGSVWSCGKRAECRRVGLRSQGVKRLESLEAPLPRHEWDLPFIYFLFFLKISGFLAGWQKGCKAWKSEAEWLKLWSKSNSPSAERALTQSPARYRSNIK